MKRSFACILCLCILLSLAACGEDTPSVSTAPTGTTADTTPAPTQPAEPAVAPLALQVSDLDQSEMTEDYISLYTVQWQNILLRKDHAAAYPALANALAAWNESEDAIAREQMAAILPDAKDAAAQFGSDFNGYTYSVTNFVQRADSHLVSIRNYFDSYTGGVRPFFASTGVNFDSETGKRLTVSQVLTDWKQLPGLLTQALGDAYPDIPEEALTGIEQQLKEYEEDRYSWTMSYQGITFYFAPSELVSSALGELTVTLWFDEHPGLFVEKYTAIPSQGYAIRLNNMETTQVDLIPGDGKRDQLSILAMDSYGLTVRCNDSAYEEEEFFAFDTDCYLVTPNAENFYLYLVAAGLNGFHLLYVFALDGGMPRCIATLREEGFSGEYAASDNGELWVFPVFNDPSCFVLSSRVEVLGTFTGKRVCYTDPNTGIPTSTTAYYEIPKELYEAMITKIDLELVSLPDMNTVTVPAGTALYPVRSDNAGYLDVVTEDGQEYHIAVKLEDYTFTVNGIPEQDCFEVLYYAG